jgi:hypothetical protein
MNLTVGPLPPAVYWRRRAIVAGGLLLVVLLLAYACSGSNASNASVQKGAGPLATAPDSPTPTFDASVPPSSPAGILPPSESTSPLPSAPPSPSVSGSDVPMCTDAQIRVTPVISSTSATTSRLVLGGTYDLKLKIRNVSTTTCRRDVGSVPEELSIANAQHTQIWSSDSCPVAGGKTSDIRTFAPNIEIYADVKWSSYDNEDHCTKAKNPAPAGKYTLTGRVGTKTATVPFTIS